MQIPHHEYTISDDRSLINLNQVTEWLTTSYWNKGTTLEKCTRAFDNSALVAGAYLGGEQVAYLRVVSDLTRFAWICDVWVVEAHRGRGLGTTMTTFALDHPDFELVNHWLLATQDAHGVYAKAGFVPLEPAENYLRFRRVPATVDNPC